VGRSGARIRARVETVYYSRRGDGWAGRVPGL
jgi:hypothetical protein